MVDDSLVARAIKTAPFPAKARAACNACFFFIHRISLAGLNVFIERKSPDRLSVGRPDFEGFGMFDDGQGLPFAFSPASPADIDVRAAFSRSVGTDLDSANSTIRRRRRSRSRNGRRRRRCLIAIIRSCNLTSSPSAPALQAGGWLPKDARLALPFC